MRHYDNDYDYDSMTDYDSDTLVLQSAGLEVAIFTR